jgi:hypothetical protein
VYLGSTFLDSIVAKVPLGYALVPVTPGTDIPRGKPQFVEAEGSKRAPRRMAPAPGEARAARRARRPGPCQQP